MLLSTCVFVLRHRNLDTKAKFFFVFFVFVSFQLSKLNLLINKSYLLCIKYYKICIHCRMSNLRWWAWALLPGIRSFKIRTLRIYCRKLEQCNALVCPFKGLFHHLCAFQWPCIRSRLCTISRSSPDLEVGPRPRAEASPVCWMEANPWATMNQRSQWGQNEGSITEPYLQVLLNSSSSPSSKSSNLSVRFTKHTGRVPYSICRYTLLSTILKPHNLDWACAKECQALSLN